MRFGIQIFGVICPTTNMKQLPWSASQKPMHCKSLQKCATDKNNHGQS